ncbi:hypothetical protein E2320_004062 [Naja naja]|nr:hypothetical protein E2320_004062 [Naja naja]
MSRRSQRIGGTLRSYQSEDTGNSRIGGGSSLLSGPQPLRTLRRKPSSVKRLSPTPSLGISSAPNTTSYYSESVINESYLTDDRGFSLKSNAVFDEPLESSSYWSEDLSRRRGTGGIESNKKINGLGDRKTYDIYGSSSGYSSEDDYTAKTGWLDKLKWFFHGPEYIQFWVQEYLLQSRVLYLAGAFSPRMAVWFVILVDGNHVVSSNNYSLSLGCLHFNTELSSVKEDVVIYPSAFVPELCWLWCLVFLSLWASTFYVFLGNSEIISLWYQEGQEMGETAVFSEAQQQALSRLQALERRFETLEAAASMLEFQKRKNTEGATPSHEDILVLLDKLMTQQEAAMREKLGSDIDLHLQNKLDAFRSQVQKDFDNLLKKVSQTSEEVETQTLEKTAQWQSSIKEGLMNTFQKEMDKLEEHLSSLKKELVTLGSHQKTLSRQVESLPGQIKEMREDVEIQFPTWFSQFLSKTGKPFVQHEELQEQLRKLEHKILAKILKDQELSVRDVGVTLHKEGITGVTEEQVHHIVNGALKRYSEDRIGMVDYALESGGASVISTRCSETYETKTALLSLFGIPLWYHSQSPRVILQPDVNPGNCWAFQGSQGFAVIRLSSRIHPTAVTLEHISKSLSPSGTIPSAPKDITIFNIDRQAAFQLVELRVLSNWGHPEYTCIYRFRVHGELVS